MTRHIDGRDDAQRTGRAAWTRLPGVLATGRIAALALVLLAAPGCPKLVAQLSGFDPYKMPSTGWAAGSAAAKSARVNTEPDSLTFVAPAGVETPNSAEVVAPYDLVPPFRVECTVGLCDPAFYPGPGAVFGMSVVERTGGAQEYSVECSRVGGITATASFGTPAPRAFSGAVRLDLALEHDGTELVGFARDHDTGGAWFEVARTPLAAPGPFLPKLDAINFDPGQMVTYYKLRVGANAPYGEGQATPQHRAVRNLAEALNDLSQGADALGAETPDAPAAELKIQAANQSVQDAVAALDAAAGATKRRDPAAKRLKAARKAALKAAKGVSKALSTLDVGGSAKSAVVVKKLGTAALDIAKAGDQVLPSDLRAAIGGLTLKSFLRK